MAKPQFVLDALTAAEATPAHQDGMVMYAREVGSGSTSSTSPDFGDYREYTRYIPAGDEEPAPGAVAVRRWTVSDHCVYGPDGALVARSVSACSQYVAAPGVVTDICGYCGADNGPQGKFREDWGCWYCNGN